MAAAKTRENLIKKRLIRRSGGGSLSLTTRGRDVLLALFSADRQGGAEMLEVKGPASNPSDMVHRRSAPNLPQTNSAHAPPEPLHAHSRLGAGSFSTTQMTARSDQWQNAGRPN